MYFTELSSLAGGGERNTAFNRKGHQALPDVLSLLTKPGHSRTFSTGCTEHLRAERLLSLTDEPFVLEDHVIHITATKILLSHTLCLLAKLFT